MKTRRTLIEEVRLASEDGTIKIELFGELSALWIPGQDRKLKHPWSGDAGV